jgi:hypothetical protein
MAKHKTQQMESQLREIIVLYGPGEAFYNEMMKTRRTIRSSRLAAAEARAKRKRFIIDGALDPPNDGSDNGYNILHD